LRGLARDPSVAVYRPCPDPTGRRRAAVRSRPVAATVTNAWRRRGLWEASRHTAATNTARFRRGGCDRGGSVTGGGMPCA